MSATGLLARQSKPMVYAAVVAIVATIGWVDWVTGREVSLWAFYSLPIYVAVWYGTKNFGLVTAWACTFAWWYANKDVHTFTTWYGYPTATFSRLLFFNFFAIGVAGIRAKQDTDRARIVAMERARKLEREVVSISEREQRRIGRDLHDGLCQTLAAIGCAATSLRDDLQEALPEHAAAAKEIESLLNEAVVEARNLARGISPVDMDEHGLTVALDELADRTSRLTPVPVTFASDGEIGLVDPEAAINLYRIAQEAVHNAVRHSSARHVEIALTQRGRKLTLSVADDGVGLPKDISGDGMGMQTMSYRAQVIGAELKINGNTPKGALVSCSLVAQPNPASALVPVKS